MNNNNQQISTNGGMKVALQVVNRKGEREDVRFDAIMEKLTTSLPRI